MFTISSPSETLHLDLEPITNENTLQQIDSITLDLSNQPSIAGIKGPTRPFGVLNTEDKMVWNENQSNRFVSIDKSVVRLDVVLNTNPYSQQAIDTIPILRNQAKIAASNVGIACLLYTSPSPRD